MFVSWWSVRIISAEDILFSCEVSLALNSALDGFCCCSRDVYYILKENFKTSVNVFWKCVITDNLIGVIISGHWKRHMASVIQCVRDDDRVTNWNVTHRKDKATPTYLMVYNKNDMIFSWLWQFLCIGISVNNTYFFLLQQLTNIPRENIFCAFHVGFLKAPT